GAMEPGPMAGASIPKPLFTSGVYGSPLCSRPNTTMSVLRPIAPSSVPRFQSFGICTDAARASVLVVNGADGTNPPSGALVVWTSENAPDAENHVCRHSTPRSTPSAILSKRVTVLMVICLVISRSEEHTSEL